VGLIASTFVIGRQQDLMYAREMRRVDGDHRKRPDFRLEQARLLVIVPYAMYVPSSESTHLIRSLFLVSVTAMGWCLQVKAPLAATLVMNFLMGIGTGTIGPGESAMLYISIWTLTISYELRSGFEARSRGRVFGLSTCFVLYDPYHSHTSSISCDAFSLLWALRSSSKCIDLLSGLAGRLSSSLLSVWPSRLA
jgi:hypothetical protein